MLVLVLGSRDGTIGGTRDGTIGGTRGDTSGPKVPCNINGGLTEFTFL